MKTPKGWKILKPVHPNSGIAVAYRAKLDDLIADMAASYDYWLRASYRANTPEMAMDAAPSRVTAVQIKGRAGNYEWFVYVDGNALTKNGAIRTFKSRGAAENAGLRSGTWNAILTEPVLFGERFGAATLATKRIAATPAANLQDALDGLGARWTARFEEAAPKLGQWFATTAARRTNAGLQRILRDGGVTVEFQMTPVMRDIFNATVSENVGLIKSIGSQYHSEVQGMVMRSVTAGRDLGGLTKELEGRFDITRRRAAFIARDQNNKSTANFVKVRQTEHNLMATWLHSAGGKEPRPTHVKNSGKIYDPKTGWYDPAVKRYIWPGTEINCRCVSRTVVKGFS